MNKTVLITGAAHGLGRALVNEYLAKDWQVIATDTDELSLADLLGNRKARVLNMDVTSDESVQTACDLLQGEDIQLDLIINNAGIDGYFPLSEAPVEQFKKVFEVNVFGMYRVNQRMLPLLKIPGGRIILISSESLNLAIPFMPYPLSKRLVEGYARVIRQELHFRGVDVVIVRPGAIRTRLLANVLQLRAATGNWKLTRPFTLFAEGASKEIGKTISPEKAAAFIYRVSTIPKPAVVYRINNSLQLKIAALLPFGLLEKVIHKKLS